MGNKVNYIHIISYNSISYTKRLRKLKNKAESGEWGCDSLKWFFMAKFHLYWPKKQQLR